jgi:proteasome lid subunit RPN8/RPN11
MRMQCASSIIDATLAHLRDAGRTHRECVVLWLGRREETCVRVVGAYRPLQQAEADVFHIPRAGMAALHDELRRQHVMVAAQVHSHPFEAFHSKADDRWAIVRHEGALSLVVPHFASSTTLANFLDQTKVYRFSPTAQWIEVPRWEVTQSCLQVL